MLLDLIFYQNFKFVTCGDIIVMYHSTMLVSLDGKFDRFLSTSLRHLITAASPIRELLVVLNDRLQKRIQKYGLGGGNGLGLERGFSSPSGGLRLCPQKNVFNCL